MRIVIAETGYLGLSNEILLSQNNIEDKDISKYLLNDKLNFRTTLNKEEDTFFNSKVIKDLSEFKKISDVLVANRLSEDIIDVQDKVYTRDIFNSDS